MNLSEFWRPYQGAVSLTFDDGTSNQLEKAIPALDKRGLKATFFINPRDKTNPAADNWQAVVAPWKAVAEAGHEIGSHTFSHTCSNNFGGRRGGLEDKTLDDLEKDILIAQERLDKIWPEQKNWTFAYPCYQTHIGRGVNRKTYVPVVAQRFLAGRAGGEYGFGNHPGGVDLAHTWGIDCTRMSGEQMIGLVENATAEGRWLVLVLHAVEGRRLSVTGHDYEMLLDHLIRRKDAIQTAPFGEIALKIKDYQQSIGLD